LRDIGPRARGGIRIKLRVTTLCVVLVIVLMSFSGLSSSARATGAQETASEAVAASGNETESNPPTLPSGGSGVAASFASSFPAGVISGQNTYVHNFDYSAEGLAMHYPQPYSDVHWDSANGNVYLLADRRDAGDEMFDKSIATLDTTADFTVTARWRATTQGNWQYAFPLFLIAGGNTLVDQANSIYFWYAGRDNHASQCPALCTPYYYMYYKDASGTLRINTFYEGQVDTEYHFLVNYDSSVQMLTMEIRDVNDAGLKLAHYRIGTSANDGFTLGKVGTASDGRSLPCCEPYAVAWVDDIVLTYATGLFRDATQDKGDQATKIGWLADNFNDNTNEIWTIEQGFPAWSGGALQLGTLLAIVRAGTSWYDQRDAFTFKFLTSGNCFYFMFRYKDSNNYYYLTICQSAVNPAYSSFQLWRSDGSGISPSIQASMSINTVYSMKVVARGNYFELWWQGQLMWSGTDYSPPSVVAGYVKFQGSQVNIDDVRIWNTAVGSETKAIRDAGTVNKPLQTQIAGTVDSFNQIHLQVRSSADNVAWGPWTNLKANVKAAVYYALPDQDRQRYYQIRAFVTSGVESTPSLTSVTTQEGTPSTNPTANTGYEAWYPYVGGLVNAVSGNVWLSTSDLSLLGKGFPLAIARSYNSLRGSVAGPFGNGWTFNYNEFLTVNPDASVTWTDGDGSQHTFQPKATANTYDSPRGVPSRLIKNGDGTFTLWHKDGSRAMFTSAGQLSSVTDKNGNTLTLTYASGRLSTVADASGKTITFAYDASGRIIRAWDQAVGSMQRSPTIHTGSWNNGQNAFSSNNLYASTKTSSALHTYSGYGFTGTTDVGIWKVQACVEAHTAGDDDLGVKISTNAGVTWSTEQIVNLPASDPNALTCLDFTSHLASWWWSNVSDANFKVQVRYVKVGNQASFDYLDWIPVTVSTASRLVRYVYDGSGNLIQAVDANGTRTQQYWYASSKLSEMTDHTGGGRYAKFTYDGSSRATEIWLGSYNGAAQWKYKAYGIAYSTTTTRTITNARGYTTTLTLNSFGNPTQISGPSIGCGACDNSGNTSSYIWDGEMNRIKVTDGRGFASTTGLDFRSNVVCRIDPGGNASSTVWSEINTASAYVALLAAQTTFRGYTTAHAYDVKGNLVKLTNAKGDYLDYVYDASGFLNRSTDFRRYTTWHEYNANGYLTKMTNPLNEVTRYGYDAWGRVVTVTSPMGFVTTSEYDKDDRLTKTIDSLGNFTSSLYNDRGDLIRTTDKNGNSTTYQVNATNGNVQVRTDALGNSTSSGFDLRGNRLTVTDANGHVTRYEYDVYDRLTKVTSPQGAIDGFFTSYVCDAAGNNIRRTDANGASTLYTYDKLERLTVTRYPDASTATQTYDEDGNPVSVAGLGYARTMAYDELGRVASVTLNYGSFAKTTTYAHDANGNRLTMTDAEGGTTAYAFDATNRQWKITDPESRITSYVYDGDSRVTSVTDPNGVNTTTLYDAAGRQRNVTTKSSGSVVLEFFNYSYDKAGNRLMMKTNEGTWGYEYDGVHRLGREVKPSGFATTYVYDAVGNRIEKVAGNSEVTYSYDLDDRLTHSSLYIGGNLWIDTSYPDYDKNGNLLRKVEDLVFEGTTYTTNYVYDLESRLKEITYPNNSKCTFSYLSTGERIGESCSPTAYVGYDFYGGGGFEDVVAEYDATGVRQARYTQGPGVDEPVGVLRSGAYYAYHVDALGSVTRITDSTQGVVRSYRYTAFGEVDSESGTLANPYGFTGRERRDGFRSYLVDDRARMYDPSIGRFLQKDPAGMADGPNLYAYVGNNPVNRADPSGMRFQEGPDDPPPSYGGGGGAGGSSSISASEPSSYGWPLRCWMGAVFLGIGIGFGLLGVYGAYISPQMWSNILYYLFTSGTWTLFRAALSGNIWAWAQLIFSLSWWAFWTFIWSSIPWFAQAAFGVQLATWATPPRWVLALGGLSLNIALGIIGLKQAGCF